MKMLRRLSPATICGKIEKPDEDIELFRIIGTASRLKPYKSAYGDSFGLMGSFEAVNSQTSEVFRSSVAYLPEPYMGAAISELQEGRPIKFALVIGVTPSEKSKTGYEFTSEPIHDVSTSDALAELRELAGISEAVKEAKQEALAAPEKKPAKKRTK